MEDKAKKYFYSEVTARDRAVFEAGLKIGALYHQFVGTPIPTDENKIKTLIEGIKNSIKTQPWVRNAEVHINAHTLGESPYNYDEISGRNLKAKLTITYDNCEVEAVIEYIKELAYPLAYISRIHEKEK